MFLTSVETGLASKDNYYNKIIEGLVMKWGGHIL